MNFYGEKNKRLSKKQNKSKWTNKIQTKKGIQKGELCPKVNPCLEIIPKPHKFDLFTFQILIGLKR